MVIRVILTSPDLQLDSDGIGLRPNSIVSLLPIDLISTGLCWDASMLQCYDDLTSTTLVLYISLASTWISLVINCTLVECKPGVDHLLTALWIRFGWGLNMCRTSTCSRTVFNYMSTAPRLYFDQFSTVVRVGWTLNRFGLDFNFDFN